jgi:hypothetical protein
MMEAAPMQALHLQFVHRLLLCSANAWEEGDQQPLHYWNDIAIRSCWQKTKGRLIPGGATVPSGSTQLTFHECQLPVAGDCRRQRAVQRDGDINGSGNYTYQVTLVDGGKTGPSLIRIKIWDTATDTIIYDSQPGTPDTATPTTALGGGTVKIH